MDKKDLRILEALDGDPRIPVTKLAKAIAVSPQVATYRLNRLFDQGLLQKCSAIVNLSKLGYKQYRVFFRFKSISDSEKTKIFNYFKDNENVYWVARIGGTYDLLCVFFVKSFPEYEEFLNDLNREFPNTIRDYNSFYVTEQEFYSHKYWNKQNKTISYKLPEKIYHIDELDLKILLALKEDARISSFNLGNKLGVTYKTIQNRVKKLEEQKIIEGYRIFVRDLERNPFIVLFSYNSFDKKKEKTLFKEIQENKLVTQSAKLFGEWNLFLLIRAKDLQVLQDLVVDLRDKYDIILDFEIIPIFKDVAINLMPIGVE